MYIYVFLIFFYNIDSLKSGAPSRIVNVSSMAHRRGGVNFDDPQYKINYDPVSFTISS